MALIDEEVQRQPARQTVAPCFGHCQPSDSPGNAHLYRTISRACANRRRRGCSGVSLLSARDMVVELAASSHDEEQPVCSFILSGAATSNRLISFATAST